MTATIADFVAEKNIEEVLHFTTNNGLLGILASNRIWSRLRLNTDDLTSDVQLPVWVVRKDLSWTDYVNLSITEMSSRMFSTSRRQHGEDVWWAVLSFSPEVLGHDGVFFTTTNNTYVPKVRRAEGLLGLQDLWSEPIPWGWYGALCYRHRYVPDNRPTDDQAEVLYPVSLSLDYLQAIYVQEAEQVDDVEGWKAATGNLAIPVIHRPEVFK